MFGRKKKAETTDLVNFCMDRIGTGQIGAYILNFLYRELEFRHIGYRIEKLHLQQRCILYTLADNDQPIQYFKDRCSGMIEEKVQTMKGIPHSFSEYGTGFEEVIPYVNKY